MFFAAALAVVAAVFALFGCEATPQRIEHRPHTTTVTPIYVSPTGGATVYRVDTPEGGETVTVTPVYRSPTGGPDVYRIERRP